MGCGSVCADGFDITTDAASAASRNVSRSLEDMIEPQKGDEALAAEGQVEAADGRAIAVKAQAEPVADVHVSNREVAAGRRHGPGVHEQRGIERPPGLPLVLGAEKHAVLVAIPELAVAAQVAGAAERGLQIERHDLAA